MSRIADKLIEIEDLLAQGLDSATVAMAAQVPLEWVIGVETEMLNLVSHECEEVPVDMFNNGVAHS